MSVDPTDCPECSGFHLGWREGPPPCVADDEEPGDPIIRPMTGYDAYLITNYLERVSGPPVAIDGPGCIPVLPGALDAIHEITSQTASTGHGPDDYPDDGCGCDAMRSCGRQGHE